VSIDELLAAGNLVEVDRGFGDGIESSDMRDHRLGMQKPLGHELERFANIVGVASRCTHHVVRLVVDIVEIEHRRETRIRGAREEVEAAVVAKEFVGHFDDAANRRKDEDIVEEFAAVELAESRDWVGDILRVDVDELDALGARLLRRDQLLCPIEPCLVDIGDDDASRFYAAVDRVVYGAEAHGPYCRKEGERTSSVDTHLVDVRSGLGVVLGMIGADNTGHWFGE